MCTVSDMFENIFIYIFFIVRAIIQKSSLPAWLDVISNIIYYNLYFFHCIWAQFSIFWLKKWFLTFYGHSTLLLQIWHYKAAISEYDCTPTHPHQKDQIKTCGLFQQYKQFTSVCDIIFPNTFVRIKIKCLPLVQK